MRKPHMTHRHPYVPASREVRKAVQAAMALALLMASGCAARLEPLPDDVASRVPASWSGTSSAMPAAPRENRWSLWMADPLLDALMNEALQAAPDLRTAEAKLAQARAQRDLAQAERRPSLSASASASRQRSSGETSTGATRNLYEAGFDASWEADLFGRLGAGVAAAEADLHSSMANLDDVHVTVLAEVARLYCEIAVLMQRTAVAESSVETQRGVTELAEWRARAGLGSELDALQSEATLEKTRAQLPVLSNTLTQTRQSLAILIGQPPAALDARLGATIALPRLPEQLAVGIPADVLRQRADVRAAEQQFVAEAARTAQARAALLPQLTLSGSLGLQALTLGALTGGEATTTALAAAVSSPLLDGGRLRAQWRAQAAVQQQAAVAYEQAVLNALADVEAALVELRTARERSTTLSTAADRAREASRVARIGYQAGLTDFSDVLTAEQSQLSIEDSLATAQGDALAAVIRLYKGLGGGWDTSRERTPPSDTTGDS